MKMRIKPERDTLNQKMIRLVLPMAFQQFMLALVGACDAVMLGRLSQNSMAAVSLASQVTFVFNLFMASFVIGENMFTAQYYGKKDYQGISKVFRLVLGISSFAAVLFFIGTTFFPSSIMHFLTNEPELINMGSEYLKYLNAVLIFGLFGVPEQGIRGAALATVAATAVQMVWCIAYAAVKMKGLGIRLLEGDRELTKRFWEKVMPVLFNELIWGGGFTMYSVILGHLGTDAVAANSIANISKNLVVCLCLGLGSAGSIIIGNLLGADHFEEAKKAGKVLTQVSIVCGALSGLFLLALSPVIVKLVTMTPTAREYLRGMLFICSYYLVGKSVNSMTIGGIFPAGGDSRFGLLCDAVTLWCITIPLGCLCAFILKIPVLGVYFVLNLDEFVKLPAMYRHYRKYGWVKNIT